MSSDMRSITPSFETLYAYVPEEAVDEEYDDEETEEHPEIPKGVTIERAKKD